MQEKLKKALSLLMVVIMMLTSYQVRNFVSAQVSGFDYDNYYELEYIESTGTQWIDANVSIIRQYRVNCNIAPTTTGYNNNVLYTIGNSNWWQEIYFFSNNKFTQWNTNTSTDNFVNQTFIPGTQLRLVYIQATNGGTLYVGQNSVHESYYTNGSAMNLTIFRYKNANNNYFYGKYKLYDFEILDHNDNTVRYFIPAERKSDGAIGLYDLISNTFFGNSGSGSFTAGPRVSYTAIISTIVDPSGSGSVTGGSTYNIGDTAVLTAIPTTGYSFSQWSTGSNDNPLSILVTSDQTITAYFTQNLQSYTITTGVNPSGSGSVSGGGTYQAGSTAVLTATPSTGYVFSSWSNGSTSNPLSLIVSADTTITANFTQEQQTTTYTISAVVDPEFSGNVTGTGTFADQTTTTLVATPSSGYQFAGWYIGTTLISSSSSLSVLVDNNYTFTAKFRRVQDYEFVPFTDTNDIKRLVDVSNLYDPDDIYFNITRYVIIDSIFSEMTGLNFDVSGNQLNHTISFVGTYQSGEFVGTTVCNSTSMTQTNTDTSPTENVTVRPFVTGSLNAGLYGSLNFGVEVVDQNLGSTQSTSSSLMNTTEACRLTGWNQGDQSFDPSMFEDLGYEIRTAYSDYYQGAQATVYIPPAADISISSTDLDNYFTTLLDNLIATVSNRIACTYHYEYDVTVSFKDNITPSYGHIILPTQLPTFLNRSDIFTEYYFTSMYDYFNLSDDSDLVKAGSNTFRFNVDNSYNTPTYLPNQYNRLEFIWENTSDPKWHFTSGRYYSALLGLWTYNGQYYTPSDYVRGTDFKYDFKNYHDYECGDIAFYTITSSDVEYNPSLTAGYDLPVWGSLSQIFYEKNDNSILNRFNQLANFLNTWFNRLHNSISNITGGSESNEITTNIVNDYDVNLDVDMYNIINNVNSKDNDIDLTAPDFVIDTDHLDNLQTLSPLATETFKAFSDNGIAIFLLLPVIIAILGLII